MAGTANGGGTRYSVWRSGGVAGGGSGGASGCSLSTADPRLVGPWYDSAPWPYACGVAVHRWRGVWQYMGVSVAVHRWGVWQYIDKGCSSTYVGSRRGVDRELGST